MIRVEEYLTNSPASELIKWMLDNQNLVYHYADILIPRLRQFKLIKESSDDINAITIADAITLLDALYTDKEIVNEIDFNLLEATSQGIVRGIIYDRSNSFTCDEVENNPILFMLVLLYDSFLSLNQIIPEPYGCLSKYFYQAIMDTYIPHSEPDVVVKTLIAMCDWNQIMQNAHNTKWLSEMYNEPQYDDLNDKADFKDVLLLFKYVSDIFTNREQKLAFFLDFHPIMSVEYKRRKELDVIVNRYEKYFHEDTAYIITEFNRLLSVYNVVKEVEDFLYEWCKKYSDVSVSVMNCLLNDIFKNINGSTKLVVLPYNVIHNMEIIRNMINASWGTEKFMIDDPVNNEELTKEDKPITYLDSIAIEVAHKDSPVMDAASKKIYKAYKTYKENEEKVDSQLNKACAGMKKVLIGDVRTEIIEGKKFSAIGLLKRYLRTVAIFSLGPIKGSVALVVKYALKKKTTQSERRKILMELDTEIELITEKIEDARGDGNREAKYAMMRTKKELENARNRIKYGMEADTKSIEKAQSVING